MHQKPFIENPNVLAPITWAGTILHEIAMYAKTASPNENEAMIKLQA